MKKNNILIIAFIILVSSSEKKDTPVYVYETRPAYTWGYAEFFGDYYSMFGIRENVITLQLLTNELFVDSTSNLKGNGQYLYLEDIFISPQDTLLPVGFYTVQESADSFSIAPGVEIENDGMKFDAGAMVYFIEKNELFSVKKFVTSGTMQVRYSGTATRLDFDFVLADTTRIKGYYEGELPYFDARYPEVPRKVNSEKVANGNSQQLNPFFFEAIKGKKHKRYRSYSTNKVIDIKAFGDL